VDRVVVMVLLENKIQSCFLKPLLRSASPPVIADEFLGSGEEQE